MAELGLVRRKGTLSVMTSHNAGWVWPIAGAFAAVVYAVWLSVWGRRRGSEFLDRWAHDHGFQVVSLRRRSFVPHWRGTSGKGYQFFRLVVRSSDGIIRKCWIRCSDFAFTDPADFEVVWDDGQQQINV